MHVLMILQCWSLQAAIFANLPVCIIWCHILLQQVWFQFQPVSADEVPWISWQEDHCSGVNSSSTGTAHWDGHWEKQSFSNSSETVFTLNLFYSVSCVPW